MTRGHFFLWCDTVGRSSWWSWCDCIMGRGEFPMPSRRCISFYKWLAYHWDVRLPEGNFKNLRFPAIRRRFPGEIFEGFELPNLREIRNIEPETNPGIHWGQKRWYKVMPNLYPRHPNASREGVLGMFFRVQMPPQEVFGCLGIV